MNNDITGSIRHWRAQRAAIKDRVSSETLRLFDMYTEVRNIGFGQGEVRPGDMGKWDLCDYLTSDWGCDRNEALIASGLTAEEVAREEGREELRDQGVNPDDARDVAQHEALLQMTPEQLEAHIKCLEAKLGNR